MEHNTGREDVFLYTTSTISKSFNVFLSNFPRVRANFQFISFLQKILKYNINIFVVELERVWISGGGGGETHLHPIRGFQNFRHKLAGIDFRSNSVPVLERVRFGYGVLQRVRVLLCRPSRGMQFLGEYPPTPGN